MRNFRKSYIKMNRSKEPLGPVGVVLHETATPGATANREYRYFNTHKADASAHGFIDWIEDVQTIPWDEKAWHAREPANSMFIGIEMCRPSNTDPGKKRKMLITYNASVDAVARIFKYVLKVYVIDKDNLMSHDEVRKKWKRTTHVDPTDYLKEIGKDMDMFRRDVQLKINSIK